MDAAALRPTLRGIVEGNLLALVLAGHRLMGTASSSSASAPTTT
jgi:hypothetical protein